MNIFVLDRDPVLAASYHCDRHVVKMILETAQLMSNCVTPSTLTYRHTHLHHPCSVWVKESKANFQWLYRLGFALCDEYHSRFGKHHKSAQVIQHCVNLARYNWPVIDTMTEFKQVMPDHYKDPSDPVQGYRNYYISDKKRFATWKNNPPPWWPSSE